MSRLHNEHMAAHALCMFASTETRKADSGVSFQAMHCMLSEALAMRGLLGLVLASKLERKGKPVLIGLLSVTKTTTRTHSCSLSVPHKFIVQYCCVMCLRHVTAQKYVGYCDTKARMTVLTFSVSAWQHVPQLPQPSARECEMPCNARPIKSGTFCHEIMH